VRQSQLSIRPVSLIHWASLASNVLGCQSAPSPVGQPLHSIQWMSVQSPPSICYFWGTRWYRAAGGKHTLLRRGRPIHDACAGSAIGIIAANLVCSYVIESCQGGRGIGSGSSFVCSRQTGIGRGFERRVDWNRFHHYWGHYWPVVPAQEDDDGVWSNRWNDWQGKLKYWYKICPIAALVHDSGRTSVRV
jgi:hypothetical protein